MLDIDLTENGVRLPKRQSAPESFNSTEDVNEAGAWTLKTSLDRFDPAKELDLVGRVDAFGIISTNRKTLRVQSGRFDEVTVDYLTGEVTLAGYLHTEMLDNRIAVPSPDQPVPASGKYVTSTWHVNNDIVDALRDVINQNARPSAPSGRGIPNLTITTSYDSPSRLVPVEFVSEYDSLLELASKYGTPANVSVRITCDGTGNYLCEVREGVIREQVVFAPETGGLSKAKATFRADTGNTYLALGQGDAPDQIHRWSTIPLAEGVQRRERLTKGASPETDATDAQKLQLLLEAARREREEDRGGRVLEVELGESQWKFGTDFDLGDLVTVIAGRLNELVAVRSVRTSLKGGEFHEVFQTGATTVSTDLLGSHVKRTNAKIKSLGVRQ